MRPKEHFGPANYGLFALATLLVAALCVCLGSVAIPFSAAMDSLTSALTGRAPLDRMYHTILLTVRLPRVLCVGLVGASLSLSGASMQGLLRNPLADGSTLGVSAGASLGAVLAIAFGIQLPFLPQLGVMGMAMAFAFGSLTLILALAWRLDNSLSTNTIILIGVIYSMFVSALMSLVIAFSGSKLQSITFWTMGSLAGSSYEDALLLLVALLLCGTVLLHSARELNAFAVGEQNARSVGVDVKAVKLRVLIAVSLLIGVCVSIGGTIGFVGLVTPHAARLIVGPNHRRLLPAVLFSGAIFLMLTDLLARTILSPVELPIGVVTSLIGAVVFVMLFIRVRRQAA